MSTDAILMGTARPLFRNTDSPVERYVLNNKPSMIHMPLPYPEQYRLNEGVFSPRKIFKHSDGFRPIIAITWDYLDRQSVRTLLHDIIENDEYFYVRPHFNFYKEYECVCINPESLMRAGIVTQPYKGTLIFTGRETITTHPISYGSFDFNGSTKVADPSGTLAINGDVSVEMWFKTPATLPVVDTTIFKLITGGAGPTWEIYYNEDIIYFETDDGSVYSTWEAGIMYANTWYFLQARRVNTDEVRMALNGTGIISATDSKAANTIGAIEVGAASNGFNGLISNFRVYSENISQTYFSKHSIEAIEPEFVNDLELWWDFSQGNTNDIAGSLNGVVTGTEQYRKESFPDNGETFLTL